MITQRPFIAILWPGFCALLSSLGLSAFVAGLQAGAVLLLTSESATQPWQSEQVGFVSPGEKQEGWQCRRWVEARTAPCNCSSAGSWPAKAAQGLQTCLSLCCLFCTVPLASQTAPATSSCAQVPGLPLLLPLLFLVTITLSTQEPSLTREQFWCVPLRNHSTQCFCRALRMLRISPRWIILFLE